MSWLTSSPSALAIVAAKAALMYVTAGVLRPHSGAVRLAGGQYVLKTLAARALAPVS